MSALLVDVTWFARQPARSGVQRVLGELARGWSGLDGTQFVARLDGQVRALEPDAYTDLVQGLFADGGDLDASTVRDSFLDGRELRASALDEAGWLLPEPSYDAETLAELATRSRRGQRVGALAYDAFPMTHPELLPLNGQASTSPYFRFLATVPLALATSDAVAQTLVGRLRRDPARTPITWLGTDHLPVASTAGTREPAELLLAGTVESRKRVELALDAVEVLRRTVPHARLVVAGRPGPAEPAVLRRLRRLSDEDSGVVWWDDPSDRQMEAAMLSASVLLSLGEEGFGLTVVEAAKRGCPVAFGGTQPAATLLEGRGAWRVDTSSPVALADDLATWCDPGHAAARRGEIDVTGLPTWSTFAADVRRHLLAV